MVETDEKTRLSTLRLELLYGYRDPTTVESSRDAVKGIETQSLQCLSRNVKPKATVAVSTCIEKPASIPIFRKRTLSSIEVSSEPIDKKAKLDPKERIKDLENQVLEFQKFVIAKGLYLETPLSMRKNFEIGYSQEKIASVMYEEIKNWIDETVEPLYEQELNCRKTGVTGDDISYAVDGIIPDIRDLAKTKGGLKLAFKLIIYLGGKSYGENRSSEDGERPSDPAADRLLVEISQQMKFENDDFAPATELKELRAQAKDLAGYGIDGFFKVSIYLFSIYCGEHPKISPVGYRF